MPLPDLLDPSRVACTTVPDKPAALALLAELLEPDAARRGAILEALHARERVGSTGLAHGVALPHAHLHGDHDRVQAAFLRLAEPIEYGAPDARPVDLLLALSMPRHCSQHLQLLAEITEQLGDPELRAALRAAPDTGTVLQLLQVRPDQAAPARA